MDIQTPVLIIGAGPAGLAVAGRLRQANIAFEILEAGQHAGNAWHGHYDRLHLHTVKELSHLPGLEFPADYPRYVPRHLLVNYFDQYARTFDIQPHFQQKVVGVKKEADNTWLTTTETGQTWSSQMVVVATGSNRLPYQPSFAGIEDFKGKLVHSRNYKNAQPYKGQKVLVVGMGNTGAEVALDLLENGAEPYIAVRGPVNIVPRDLLGNPTQLTALKLAKLPYWLGDAIGYIVGKITVGDLRPYGIQPHPMPPSKQLRTTGQTPVMDIGTLKQIKAGRIKIVPNIKRFDAHEVTFDDGRRLLFDAVILCTGYKAALLDFLPAEMAPQLDGNGYPKTIAAAAPYDGLFFNGFDNYTPGGILGVINRDSALIASAVAQALKPA